MQTYICIFREIPYQPIKLQAYICIFREITLSTNQIASLHLHLWRNHPINQSNFKLTSASLHTWVNSATDLPVLLYRYAKNIFTMLSAEYFTKLAKYQHTSSHLRVCIRHIWTVLPRRTSRWLNRGPDFLHLHFLQ